MCSLAIGRTTHLWGKVGQSGPMHLPVSLPALSRPLGRKGTPGQLGDAGASSSQHQEPGGVGQGTG